MAISKQIKGKNLCETSCVEKNLIIHPENSINEVLLSEDGNTTLEQWIMGGLSTQNNTEPTIQSSLKEWLQTYYNGKVDLTLPTASASELGAIKVGNYLTINPETGVLSVNKQSLNIPTQYELIPASISEGTYVLGGINVYSMLKGKEEAGIDEGVSIADGGTITIEEIGEKYKYQSILQMPSQLGYEFTEFYTVPVSIIKSKSEITGGKAEECVDLNATLVSIPKNLFSYNDLRETPVIPAAQIQSDWNQTNSSSKDYIKNKPTIPAAQIQSDWEQSDNTLKDYIKNKPTIPTIVNNRTVKGPTYNNTWSWDEFSKIIETIYTGNPVVNLLSYLDKDAITCVFNALFNVDSAWTNITLYIPEIAIDSVKSTIRLTCYSNATNSFSYTDDGNGVYTFNFGTGITKIDCFKGTRNDIENVTLYITSYSQVQPTPLA